MFTAARICFSRQILPGARTAPMPQPACIFFFHVKSFLDAFHPEIATRKLSFFHGRSRLGRGLPRCRSQQASLLSGSIAFRAASTPIPALNLLFSSIPARTRHVFRSIYVPEQPPRSRPGTYQACFPLILRAGPAPVFESRHVPGMLPTLLTCPGSHSVSRAGR